MAPEGSPQLKSGPNTIRADGPDGWGVDLDPSPLG